MNRSQLRREIDDLLTCNARDVDGIYEKAVEIFARHTSPGWTFSFRAAQVDGTPHYDAIRADGSDGALDELASSMRGAPILKGPTLNVFRPEPDDINRFKHLRLTGPAFEGTPLKRHMLDPFKIDSCLRIMIYRDRRFAGWLGTFRSSNHPGFEPRHLEAFRALEAPLKVAYSTADRFVRHGAWEGERLAILTASGHLDFASPDLRDRLPEEVLETLGSMVRSFESGDVSHSVRIVEGVEARISRVEGKGLSRYVAQLVAPTPVLHDPLAILTPAQRQVATLAARGLSAPEIADHLQRSPHTVKVHLRAIYQRLGVSSRLELASLMEE